MAYIADYWWIWHRPKGSKASFRPAVPSRFAKVPFPLVPDKWDCIAEDDLFPLLRKLADAYPDRQFRGRAIDPACV